ncbi:MAG: hypothetical protein ACO3ND_05410 [Opitutales bacterium]
MSERTSFPSRTAYLLLGAPASLLATSLVTARITPALNKMLARSWSENTSSYDLAIVLACLIALGASFTMATLRAGRLGWSFAPLWGALSCVPILGAGVAFWLGAASDEDEGDGVWRLAGRLAVPAAICWLCVAAFSWGSTYLLIEHGDNGPGTPISVYLIYSSVILTPLTTGFVVGLLAGRAGRSGGHAVGAAICTLAAVMTMLGFAAMEGVVCMLMAAAPALMLGVVGAIVGHFVAGRTTLSEGRMQSAAWLALLVLASGERLAPPSPLEDEVSSVVTIDATPAEVWARLKDIRDLPEPKETLFVLGVAHPLETFVEGEGGVGARRVCRLSTGDMPELITVWKPGEELRFKVLETPAPMKEAALLGREIDAPHLHGSYASLEGGFRLEALPGGRTRLTGTSRYLLNLAPASYWNLWTREIVSQVQLRVMNHVKALAEAR